MNPPEKAESEKPGLVALNQGEIRVADPLGGGPRASLRPGAGVKVLVNGNQINENTPVSSADSIVIIQPADIAEPARAAVRIAPDGLSAEAALFPPRTIKFSLVDRPFAPDLVVEAVSREEHGNFELAQALEMLKAQGLRFGVRDDAVAELLDQPGVWKIVATGRPAVQGRDGWIQYLYEEQLKKVVYDESLDRVNYRERFEILQVNDGDSLALVHPPVPGEPGLTVTGREIAAPAVRPAEVRCERGAVLSPGGGRVLATRLGIPVYHKGQPHIFRVDNLYIHQGNIDIRSGNTAFKGHLKINGDIMEGMTVTADGDIEVMGDVLGADLSAEGQVFVKKNCISCRIRAGWKQIALQDFRRHLEVLTGQAGQAGAACQEVLRTLAERGQKAEERFPMIARLIIQSKFPDLPRELDSLAGKAQQLSQLLPEGVPAALGQASRFFLILPDSEHPVDSGKLQQVRLALLEALNSLSGSIQEKMSITAYYVQNCTLTCTGDIIITGPGAYNSALNSGGSVRVARIFRSGEITAGGDVWIGEAGVPRLAGIQGTINVPYDRTVYLGKAHETTQVKIGSWSYRFDQTLAAVSLSLDLVEKRIRVLPWKGKNTPA